MSLRIKEHPKLPNKKSEVLVLPVSSSTEALMDQNAVQPQDMLSFE